MEEKKPVDRIRDSSGHADVGTSEDGAIMEMQTIGGRLLIIKERSIYEMVFADSVDPERTNANLPPTIHRLIIDKGVESEIVAKIFLTAKTLFRDQFMPSRINCESILSLAIDILKEIAILEKEINGYIDIENKVCKEYEDRRTNKDSYQLPSIVNLNSSCKTIFQKADHVEQTLMEIVLNFYSSHGITKQSHFPKLYEVLIKLYGETDDTLKYFKKVTEFMRIVRELRNGFDHRLTTVVVTDFELQKTGEVLSPTIKLNSKEVNLDKTSLSNFLQVTLSNLIDIVETTFAFLAMKNVKTEGFSYQLRVIPEDQRRYKYLKFSFWLPIGPEGMFLQ
jgi:hypothetical protein